MSLTLRRCLALLLALTLGLGAPLPATSAEAGPVAMADRVQGMEGAQMGDCCLRPDGCPCRCHQDRGACDQGTCAGGACAALAAVLPGRILDFTRTAEAPFAVSGHPSIPSPPSSGPFRPPRA